MRYFATRSAPACVERLNNVPKACNPAPVTADTDALGSWRRGSSGNVRLRAAPALTAPIVRDLPQHTVVHIDGAVQDWYRVQLPDGTAGFVSGRLTESTGQPVRTAHAGAVPPDRDTTPVQSLVLAGAWRRKSEISKPSISWQGAENQASAMN